MNRRGRRVQNVSIPTVSALLSSFRSVPPALQVRTLVETDPSALVKAYRVYLANEKARLAKDVVDKTSGRVRGLLDFAGGEKRGEERPELTDNRKLSYMTERPEGSSMYRQRELMHNS